MLFTHLIALTMMIAAPMIAHAHDDVKDSIEKTSECKVDKEKERSDRKKEKREEKIRNIPNQKKSNATYKIKMKK